MSTPILSVYLYSKYSNKCKELIDNLPQKVDFLKYLCVDNKKVRRKILNDSRFNIQHVPCILIFLENGTVEKYEGNDAFKWSDQFTNVNQNTSLIDDNELLDQIDEEDTQNNAPMNTQNNAPMNTQNNAPMNTQNNAPMNTQNNKIHQKIIKTLQVWMTYYQLMGKRKILKKRKKKKKKRKMIFQIFIDHQMYKFLILKK